MDYGKDFNVIGLNAIRKDEWGFGDDEFAGAGNSAETTHFREFLKCFEAFFNPIDRSSCCIGAICHDVFAGLVEVKKGEFCPDYFHLRCSLAAPFCKGLGDLFVGGEFTCVSLTDTV